MPRSLTSILVLGSSLSLLVACPSEKKKTPPASKRAPTAGAQKAAKSATAPGIPRVLKVRYPSRDLAPFSAYRIANLPLYSVTGRGNAICKPAWVVAVDADKVIVGRELLRRRLAVEPAPTPKEFARLTLDLLLQQRGRPILDAATHKARCTALPAAKAAKLVACKAGQGLKWVAAPTAEGKDKVVFWRKPCTGDDADRVRLSLGDLAYDVASTKEIELERRIAADPIDWVRSAVLSPGAAGPQRDALKKLPKACVKPAQRTLLHQILEKNPHHIVRVKATIYLARCGPHASTTTLLMRRAESDPHVQGRQAAVDILGSLRARRAIPLLRRLANDTTRPLAVRYAAKRSLATLEASKGKMAKGS